VDIKGAGLCASRQFGEDSTQYIIIIIIIIICELVS